MTWQLPVPEQAPVQPMNLEPAAGVGVRVTTVLVAKSKVQVAPQPIPGRSLATVPPPFPLLVTVSVCVVPATAGLAKAAARIAIRRISSGVTRLVTGCVSARLPTKLSPFCKIVGD